MIWLSYSTSKWLSADLKFKEKQEKKEEAKADAKGGKGAPPKGAKLDKTLEAAAWGL